MSATFGNLEVGYDVPAVVGARVEDIQTPALIIDLDAFERNCARMAGYIDTMGVRLRAHAKTHKSADVSLFQIQHGGACGICCQKVSEAEALVRAGIRDVLIANEVTDPVKIDRLARLCKQARVIVCCDNADNIIALSQAASRHDVLLEVLVEVDCGASRCGVSSPEAAVELSLQIAASPNLIFSGIQAYHGAAQHIVTASERQAAIDGAVEKTRSTVALLKDAGFECAIIAGAGTGSYNMEGKSGIYNELQCGSYVFMDADYGRVQDTDGTIVGGFENALFVLTSVMSKTTPNRAICDAGLKAHSVDSGLPVISERPELFYVQATDEHGAIEDPQSVLAINERLKLIPGHCDPTCNLHDWYVCVRNGRVEALWPVTARGKLY